MPEGLGTLLTKARMAHQKGILLQVLINNLELQYYLKIKRESFDHSHPDAIRAAGLRLARAKRLSELLPKPAVDFASIQNRLPNSGGLEFDDETVEAQKSSVSEEFEGVHVKDAFRHAETWQQLSFVRQAESVADVMSAFLGRAQFSVLELGCGGGAIFNALRYLGGAEYIGVDINSTAQVNSEIVRGNPTQFRTLNLQQELDFGRTFDCVCSFEVFEHLREESSDEAIKSIRNHMTEKSLFIGTISRVAGIYHINAHDRVWWMKKFEAHGLGHRDRENRLYEEVIARSYAFNWRPRYS
ncbi:MAG: class I SAM-dependent methyltransferase, partial [Bdellovibrionota bacterium]